MQQEPVNYVNPTGWEPTAQNRYYYYEFLHFIPTELKDKFWAAQCLLFNKMNSAHVVDPEKAALYRQLDKGIIDKQTYVNIIDPKQKGGGGGEAKYFSADWKSNPINIHIQNILEARLDKLPITLTVKAADEYFQLNQQKENAKILGRKNFLNFLNELNQQLGLPQLRPDEDPYKYVEQMAVAAATGKLQTADTRRPAPTSQDLPTTMLDNIKASIEDNEELALFNEYIYKDGVEAACEIGMQYYMDINKWKVASDNIKADIRNFNTAMARFYTSKTTGRPVLEYIDCTEIQTGVFKQKDGSDMPYWWREYSIPFGEFVRQFGAELTMQQLQLVFEKNRESRGGWGTGHGLYWDKCNRVSRENALIRIGYMEWMTQDIAVYSGGVIRGNYRFKQMPTEWEPKKNSPYSKEARYYNCWYKCYYVPTFVGTSPSNIQTSDFDLQKEYIFDYGKLQDQFREGDDQRFSRSSLVTWRNPRPSWTDIEQRFAPKITLLWLHYQNDLANIMPHGLYFNEDSLTSLLETVDEAQADGKDSNGEAIRRLKQTGYGIGKLMDEQGRQLTPFVDVKSAHLASAKEKLIAIMDLYVMMTQSLGFNEIAEGQAPQPRQSLGAIQIAMDSTNNATYFLEKGYIDIYTELGYRLLNYFRDVINEKDSDRLREFEDIVGRSTAWALEAIYDIPYRRIGITVDAMNTNEQNNFINQMALEMAKGPNPLITPDEALELTFVQNVKYKFAILRLKLNKRRKQMLEQQAQAAAAQNELLIQQAQLKQQEIEAKGNIEAMIVNLMKQWDARLMQMQNQDKYVSQSNLKEQIKDNRIEQDAAAVEMEKNMEAQAPLV